MSALMSALSSPLALIPAATKNNHRRWWLCALLASASLPNLAHAGWFGGLGKSENAASHQREFLTAEQAFVLSSSQTADTLTLSFDIAPGYYLYRHQLLVTPKALTLGEWQLPLGEPHSDAYFGESQVYKQPFTLSLPLQQRAEQAQVTVHYQGCTTDLCYAPQTVLIPLTP